MIIAEKEIGVKEVDGPANNQRVIQYHATTTLKATEDSVPWCASFVNWCVTQAGIKGTNSAAAKSWLGWGEPLVEPEEGCVCVIRQKHNGSDPTTGSASGYHVAFWVKESDGRVFLLGGNQGDQVKISSFGLGGYEICGYRRPVTA
jgi:uncharacterized protein (TIGR02594 family)